MIEWFIKIDPVYQSMMAGLFSFFITTLGASFVFLFKKDNKTLLDGMLGFSAGIMIAASFFSLLSPALELSDELKLIPYIICSAGFITGGLILFCGDRIIHKCIHDTKSNIKRIILLVSSITLHNIPEGLAIGVAFGSVKYGISGASIISAVILTIGIAIQNFPEGSAVSLPLKREGISKTKSFIIGSLSAIVEPVSAMIGAYLVIHIRIILPFVLSLAAGAMIYVVSEEIIPESQTNEAKDLMAITTIIGFVVMMVLDLMFN